MCQARTFLAAVTAIFALSIAANADEKHSSALDAKYGIGKSDPSDHWRMMDDGFATSRCIGDLRTPICAAETELACYVQQREKWCVMIFGLPKAHYAMPREGDHPLRVTVLYQVVSVEWASDKAEHLNNPDRERNRDPATARDIYVALREIHCYADGCNPPTTNDYRMRRTKFGLWDDP